MVQSIWVMPISLKKPSWLLVALSLLCAGWLLGYGAAAWNTPSTKYVKANGLFGERSPSGRDYPAEPLSWRNAPTTTRTDSGR